MVNQAAINPTATKGNTVNELNEKVETARANQGAAASLAAAARARASQERNSGNQAMGQGTASKAQGMAGIVAAGIQEYFARAMIKKGMAMNTATPAAGAALISAGKAMEATAAAQFLTGTMQMTVGSQQISQGTSKLAKAVTENVISKEQASIATKEMIRSQLYEAKKNILEDTLKTIMAEGKLKGSEGEGLSEKEITKLQASSKAMLGKAFESGAKALANNGILSLQDGDRTRYFMENEETGISEISIKTDSKGQPILDKSGRLELDPNKALSQADPLDEDQQLELKLGFALKNQMEDILTGSTNANGQKTPGLTRLEINPLSGDMRKGFFDIKNPEHMKEFSQIVDTVDKNPPPLKFGQDEKGELYFQQWDWNKNQAKGNKVLITDLAGGNLEKGDKKWLKKAKNTANKAFESIGLGKNSETYKLLAPLANESVNKDFDLEAFQDYLKKLKPDARSMKGSNGLTSI